MYAVYVPSNTFGMWLPTPKTEMDGSMGRVAVADPSRG